MKTLIVSAALVSILAAAAQADLVIESKVESPQVNTPMTTKIKGDKVRTDMNAGPMGAMSVIMDNKSGDSINLMHAPKIAMKTSGAQMKQTLEMAKQLSGAPAADATKPQKSSQSEKVGEYDCDIYTWNGGAMTARYWVAKSHPQAVMLKDAEKNMNAGVLGAAQSGPDTTTLPGPVLKTETVTAGQTTTVTVVSVKEQKLDDKDFETPADYKAMAMPQMPGFGGEGAGPIPAPRRAPAPGGAPAGGGAPPPGAK
jgi:hypothetical protein